MKYRIGRLSTPLAAVIILILSSLVSFQCFKQPLEPVAPNWDIQLSVPIVDTIYYLKDALKGNPNITTSGIFYEYRPQPYNFDPILLADTSKLKLNPHPQDTMSVKQLGTITIEPTATTPLAIPVTQIIPPITINRPPPMPDTTIVISGTDTTVVNPICIPRPPLPDTCVFTEFPASQFDTSIAFPPSSEFDYIKIETGGLRLRVENRMPLQTLFAVLKLVNSDNDTITTFPPLSIPGRGVKDTTVNFVPGTKLTSLMTAVLSVSSPATPLPVTFLPGDGLTFLVELTTLTSNEAKIAIPALPLADIQQTQLILDDSTYVRRVEFFRRGGGNPESTIRVSLQSTIGASVGVRFKFRELISAAGDTFVIDTLIPPRGGYIRDIVLPDWFLMTPDSNNIHYEVQMYTLQASVADTIFSTSGVSIRVQFLNTPFYIRSIQGRAKPFALVVDELRSLPEIRLGSSFTADSINFPDTLGLLLNLQTPAGHPIDINNFRIIGYADSNGVDQRAVLTVPSNTQNPNIWRFRPGQLNTIQFPAAQLNPFFRFFPNNQPRSLRIVGAGIVNPLDVYNNRDSTGHIGTITVSDSFFSSASFAVPLQVAIYNGEFRDTVRISDTANGGTQIDSTLLTSIIEGNFYFRIQNSIPVSLTLKSEFYNRAGVRVLPSSNVPLDSVTIGYIPGTPVPVRESVFRLSRNQAKKFGEASRGIVRLLLGTGNSSAVFDTTQSVRIRMYANLKFNVNPTRY